ncbi:MAG TPA: hypothetical protein VJ790_09250 [Dongiaceae bacterium]|nr:hypothetical protein [Dongiaceae bacterium]
MPKHDTERDKPAIKRDRAGHFTETEEPSAAQPDFARADAAARRRAAKTSPAGGESDKGDRSRRRLRT